MSGAPDQRAVIQPGNSGRLLETMQELLALPAADMQTALVHASDLVARALGADKVDAFLYEEARDSLVAYGTSTQPLSSTSLRRAQSS